MSACNNIYYQGETITFSMNILDDNGDIITNFSGYTIDALIRNESGKSIYITDSSIAKESSGKVTFFLSATDTKELIDQCYLELRVTKGEDSISIGVGYVFTILESAIGYK